MNASALWDMNSVALISIAGMYLLVYKTDAAYPSILADTRARELKRHEEVLPLWEGGTIDPCKAWYLKGIGTFSIAAMHLWRHSVDFVYLDIGANIGMTTIPHGIFFQRCGRNNKIFSFEPGDVFPLLKDSVTMNRLEEIVLCSRLGVSDRTETAEFFVTPAQHSSSTMLRDAAYRPGIERRHPITIKTTTIDDFLQEQPFTPALLIKIDAEGLDFRVLDGMKATINSRFCVIQMELYINMLETYSNPTERLICLSKDFEIIECSTGERIAEAQIPHLVEKCRGLGMPGDIILISKSIPDLPTLVERIVWELGPPS